MIPLFLLLLFVYLNGLGNCPLTEQSEARYTEVAWEMTQTSDYLTPRYNGIKHFHKPPLYYWCVAASFNLFGVSEFTARFPNFLFTCLTLAMTGWFAARGFCKKGHAWIPVLLLGTSPFFWQMGRVAITDMMVTAQVMIALAAAWTLMERGDDWRAVVCFWTSLGLSFLTKGPVGPLVVGLALVPYLFLTRPPLRRFRPLPGLLLAAAVGVPWYIWVCLKNPGLFNYFFMFQTVDRVFTTVHHRTGPVWFYLPVLLAGFLPWSPWVILGIKREYGRSKRQEGVERTALLLGFWILMPTAFFSLLGSKLPAYVLPVFPALALLAARSIEYANRRWLLSAPACLFPLGLACVIVGKGGFIPTLAVYQSDFVVVGTLLILGSSVCFWLGYKLRPDRYVLAVIVTMLALLSLAGFAFSKVSRKTSFPIAEAIKQAAQTEDYEVASFARYMFGFPYYLDRRIVHIQHPRESQFETNSDYQNYIFDDLPSYLPVFYNDERERFLIFGKPEWEIMRGQVRGDVIYDSEGYVVVHRPKRDG